MRCHHKKLKKLTLQTVKAIFSNPAELSDCFKEKYKLSIATRPEKVCHQNECTSLPLISLVRNTCTCVFSLTQQRNTPAQRLETPLHEPMSMTKSILFWFMLITRYFKQWSESVMLTSHIENASSIFKGYRLIQVWNKLH